MMIGINVFNGIVCLTKRECSLLTCSVKGSSDYSLSHCSNNNSFCYSVTLLHSDNLCYDNITWKQFIVCQMFHAMFHNTVEWRKLHFLSLILKNATKKFSGYYAQWFHMNVQLCLIITKGYGEQKQQQQLSFSISTDNSSVIFNKQW